MTRTWFQRGRAGLRAAAACTLALALTRPAGATWSIVVLNRDTGEVAVATSTCIPDSDISFLVPVVRVGVVAGASQSFVDPVGRNKRRIYNHSPREGATPQILLDLIESLDGGFETRQFGIVMFTGPPVTHTGTQNFATALGVTGQVGPYDYAIQGNILTGDNVVYDCEAAFLNTPGDLGQRMIAAMEAARDAGGDGRCSCSPGMPTSCGSPPASFTHASYNACMVIARHGDTDNTLCNNTVSCVNGDYYLKLTYVGNQFTPEPIAELRSRYDAWRAAHVGRPDHVLTDVDQTLPRLRADGRSTSVVTVRLRDVDGTALTSGGQTLTVVRRDGNGAIATVQNHVDHGDGTHSFEFRSTAAVGEASYAIVVDDGVRPVELYPRVRLASIAPEDLHLGLEGLEASEGGTLPFLVDLGPATAGARYRILGSLSGTTPPAVFGGQVVPLARDRFFDYTASWPGGAPFVGNAGTLDADGRAEARFEVPAGALVPFVGAELGAAVWSDVPPFVTARQGIPVLP